MKKSPTAMETAEDQPAAAKFARPEIVAVIGAALLFDRLESQGLFGKITCVQTSFGERLPEWAEDAEE